MSVVGRSQQALSGFDPVSLGGCALWLDAADRSTLTLSGSNVTQWRDKSGNGHAFSNYTGTTRISNTVQYGNPAVYFDGSSGLTNASLSFPNASNTVFAVAYQEAQGGLANYRRLLNGGGATANLYFFLGALTSNYATFVGNGTTWNDTASNSPATNIFRQWSLLEMTTSGSNLVPYVNGTALTTKTTGTTGAFSGLSVGGISSGDAQQAWVGYCAEVLIYNSVLTSSQRQAVEGYLAWKWGIPTTPLDVPGCALWLDAADTTSMTLSGSNVTQWRDKSGNSNHATAAGNAAVLSSNSILFTGTAGVSSTRFTIPDTPALRLTTPFTIYMVYAATALTPTSNNDYGSMILLSKFVDGGSYPGWAYRARAVNSSNVIFTAQFFNSAGSGRGDIMVTSSNVVDGTRKIIGLNQRTSNAMFTFVNGSADLTIDPMLPPISSTDTMMIGARNTTNPTFNAFNGSVNEIIIHTGSLSRDQCQQIETYLARKWSLTLPYSARYPRLPATHPYRLTLPTYRDFSPLDLDGLSLWLDAADPNSLTLSGSNVTQWRDKSGNGRNANASSRGPVYSSISNHLAFDGSTGSVLTLPDGTIPGGDSPYYMTAVVTPQAGSYFMSSGRAGDTAYLYQSVVWGWNLSNQLYDAWLDDRGDCVGTTSFSLTNTRSLVAFQYSSPNRTIFANGTSIVTKSNTRNGNSISNAIGSYWTFYTGYGTFLVNEIILLNTVPTSVQRQQVEAYLARKWGLQSTVLAGTSHPYRYGPAVVLPTQISGCALWLDAADATTLTLSGSNVTQWRDKSGNAYSAATYSGTITRTTQNGQGALNFGTGVMKIGSYGWPAYSSTFVVARTATGNFLMVQSRNDNEYLSLVYTGNWNLAQIFDGTTKLVLNDSVIAQGTPIVGSNQLFMLGFGYNGGTASSFYTLNGSNRATTLVSGSGLSNVTTTGQPLYINGRWNTSLDNSVVCEILQFSRSLSSTERQQLEGYLAWKWGLQSNLPTSNHPFLLSKSLTPTFTPLQLSGLSLWLDAADSTAYTLSGSNVTAIRDKSPSNVSFSNSTGFVLSNTFNGSYPSFFNGTILGSAILGRNASFTGTAPYTIFWVGQRAAAVGPAGFLFDNTTGGAGRWYVWDPTATYITNEVTTTFISTTAGVFSTTFGGSNFFANGTSQTVTSTGNSNGTTNGLTIGNARGSDTAWGGHICEMLFYASNVSATDRQRIEGYLAAKWGLRPSLPPSTNHPYRFGPWVGTPTQISGCALWLDAADSNTLTLSGSNVTQWTDKSGNSNHMTPVGIYSNATVQSNYQNGLSALNFTGSNVYQTPSNSAIYPSDVYILVALKSLSGQTDVIGIGSTTSDNFNSLTYGEYTSNRWHNGSSGFARTPNTVSPSNETSTSLLLMNWSLSNNNFVIRRNGTELSSTASYTFTLTSGSRIQIGLRYLFNPTPPPIPFNAYVAEVVIFNRQLGTTERQQIEGYLAWKWGLQGNLTAGAVAHPYKSFTP